MSGILSPFTGARPGDQGPIHEKILAGQARQSITANGYAVIGMDVVGWSELDMSVAVSHTVGLTERGWPELLLIGSNDAGWLKAVFTELQRKGLKEVEARINLGRTQKAWVRPIDKQETARRLMWRVPEITGSVQFPVWQVVMSDPLGFFPPECEFPFNLAPIL